MVANGSVRKQDKDGNEAAGRAADLDRRRQLEHLINARRRIQNALHFWVPYCK